MRSMENKKSRKQKLMENKIGCIAWMLQLVCSIFLMIILLTSRLIPALYGTAIAIGLVFLLAATGIGILMPRERLIRLITTVVSVLISVVLIVAGLSVKKASDTLSEMSNMLNEMAQMSVYVFDGDKAESIEDAQDYDFGILSTLDRDNTDKALEQIEKHIGRSVNTVSFSGITKLADAMIDNKVQAIILNEEYVKMLSEWEEDSSQQKTAHSAKRDYPEFASSLRRLATYKIESTRSKEYKRDNKKFIMYISGIDTWGGISTRSRSDVNIMAVVNTQTKQILLISTPRDYYVPLSISNGKKDKLTHAGIYGVQCSLDTLSTLYDTNIDYYFRVNFSGFEKIIDELGGITVWSDYEFDVKPDFHYVKGDNYLSGLEALAFARERHALPAGDNSRGQNQMNVIISVMDKLCSSAILANYSNVLESLKGTFETDMPYDTLASIVRQQLADGTKWDILSYAVTGKGSTASTYSMGSQKLYVMKPNKASVENAQNLIKKVMSGEKINNTDIYGQPNSEEK